VTDPTGEAIYLRDEDTGAVWGGDAGTAAAGIEQRTLADRAFRRHDSVSSTRLTGWHKSWRCLSPPMIRSNLRCCSLTNTSRRVKTAEHLRHTSNGCLGPPAEEDRRFVID
jgi:hypothetical protein